jgi:hypothetical protein
VRLLPILLFLVATTCRADLGLNVYGVSWHFDQDKAKELGVDNQVNPGLGVRWRSVGERWDWFADAGFYRDSGSNTAKLAGAGALWHLGESLRLGGALALLGSDTYNGGKTFMVPLPLAAYETPAVTFNMVYLPKVRGLNDIHTLGFWLTFWLR